MIISKRLLSFWIIKEAAIKWQEGSISRDLSSWLIKENKNEAYHKKLPYYLKY